MLNHSSLPRYKNENLMRKILMRDEKVRGKRYEVRGKRYEGGGLMFECSNVRMFECLN